MPEIASQEELEDLVAKAQFFFTGFGPRTIEIPVTKRLAEVARREGLRPPPYATRRPMALQVRLTTGALAGWWHCWWKPEVVLIWEKSWSKSGPRLFGVGRLGVDVDRHKGQWDGWAWAHLPESWKSEEEHRQSRETAKRKFDTYLRSLPRLQKCYAFGTGPSLDSAWDRDFSDGYRVVCNTIVKNEALLRHIRPHFIVAADAIYHYGNTIHATAFREDLASLLRSTETRLLLPEGFSMLLLRDFPDIAAKVIPVDTSEDGVFLDLREQLAYTSRHNVLNSMLLPLASTLADEVHLLGFDGRVPGAVKFWRNSEANSYGELRWTIEQAHPGFFALMDYEKYAEWQSEGAEEVMAEGEKKGKRYTCLNDTVIPALRSRRANTKEWT